MSRSRPHPGPRRRGRRPRSRLVWPLVAVMLTAVALMGVALIIWAVRTRAPAVRGEDRLLGTWEADVPDRPGKKLRLEVQPGRMMVLAVDTASGQRAGEELPWKVLEPGRNQLTIQLSRPDHPEAFNWQVEFLSDDQMRIISSTPDTPTRLYTRLKAGQGPEAPKPEG